MNCGCDLGVEMHDANNKTIQIISESVVLRFRSGSGVLYCNNSQSVPFLSYAFFNCMHQNGGNTTFLSKSLN